MHPEFVEIQMRLSVFFSSCFFFSVLFGVSLLEWLFVCIDFVDLKVEDELSR